jgi:hypothetical protein
MLEKKLTPGDVIITNVNWLDWYDVIAKHHVTSDKDVLMLVLAIDFGYAVLLSKTGCVLKAYARDFDLRGSLKHNLVKIVSHAK